VQEAVVAHNCLAVKQYVTPQPRDDACRNFAAAIAAANHALKRHLKAQSAAIAYI
jgi:hypothetical protein